jgi:hypothetical protein
MQRREQGRCGGSEPVINTIVTLKIAHPRLCGIMILPLASGAGTRSKRLPDDACRYRSPARRRRPAAERPSRRDGAQRSEFQSADHWPKTHRGRKSQGFLPSRCNMPTSSRRCSSPSSRQQFRSDSACSRQRVAPGSRAEQKSRTPP